MYIFCNTVENIFYKPACNKNFPLITYLKFISSLINN